MEDETPGCEHVMIATSLEVEQLDKDLFTSKTLYLPAKSRGAFGGQVISQALVSATNCVDPSYILHSMHCYFLLSASPAVPILYYVESLREGRTYTTRSVKTKQKGQIVFVLMCSFQKAEFNQPKHYFKMLRSIKQPDELLLDEDVMEQRLKKWTHISDENRALYKRIIAERRASPIAIKEGSHSVSNSGELTETLWMKAKDIPRYSPPFQKCILSYMSDLRFLGVAARQLGLRRTKPAKQVLGMISSLDHSVFFYDDDFHCGEWMLYIVQAPAAANGRAVVVGRWYTQTGKLIAVCTQEGVVRAETPVEPVAEEVVKAKL